jgi:hypothetical protein
MRATMMLCEAEVVVSNPKGAVKDWKSGYYTADVQVAIAQDPNMIVIRGIREQVTKCLVDDLCIDPTEAGDYVTFCATAR